MHAIWCFSGVACGIACFVNIHAHVELRARLCVILHRPVCTWLCLHSYFMSTSCGWRKHAGQGSCAGALLVASCNVGYMLHASVHTTAFPAWWPSMQVLSFACALPCQHGMAMHMSCCSGCAVTVVWGRGQGGCHVLIFAQAGSPC